MFCVHFRSGLVSRGQLQIIVVDSRCFREAPGSYEVKLGNCGDIGTDTKSTGIGTHMQLSYNGVLVPVPNQSGTGTQVLLENHTNWYRYQHVIFAGFQRNFDLGPRARSSFDSHFEITNMDFI